MGTVYFPESAMAVVAHPDDIEFSYAGTLARWGRAGRASHMYFAQAVMWVLTSRA